MKLKAFVQYSTYEYVATYSILVTQTLLSGAFKESHVQTKGKSNTYLTPLFASSTEMTLALWRAKNEPFGSLKDNKIYK